MGGGDCGSRERKSPSDIAHVTPVDRLIRRSRFSLTLRVAATMTDTNARGGQVRKEVEGREVRPLLESKVKLDGLSSRF